MVLPGKLNAENLGDYFEPTLLTGCHSQYLTANKLHCKITPFKCSRAEHVYSWRENELNCRSSDNKMKVFAKENYK